MQVLSMYVVPRVYS